MKSVVFIKNALVLTITSLILRSVGIVFRVYMVGVIGSEGTGLYQLIFSVYMLFATFATTGVCTAVTRLIAECGENNKNVVKVVMLKATVITLFVALLSTLIVFIGADFISINLLKDSRAALALKILSFSLPFMGVSSCIRGYFIARRKTITQSMAQIFEQIVRIVIVVGLLSKFAYLGVAACAAVILLGDTIAEISSCLFLYLGYLRDKSKLQNGEKIRPGIYRSILKVSLPIAGGRYVTTALHTAENLIVPIQLALFTLSSETALSQFGMIKGMAMPILFFPASFLTAMSTMLVPEISEAAVRKNKYKVDSATRKAIKTTTTASILIAIIFLVTAPQLGELIYHSSEVGYIIRVLSPIVPFMYLESVVDGILKGLDQQLHSFWYNVIDSVSRIGAIFILVPRFGLIGFLGVMIISNIVTSTLNCHRLLKVTNMKLDLNDWVAKPLFSAIIGGLLALLVEKYFSFGILHSTIIEILLQIGVFFALMFLIGGIKKENVAEYVPKKLSKAIIKQH